jgi:mono/diheme cytochrome c family protein
MRTKNKCAKTVFSLAWITAAVFLLLLPVLAAAQNDSSEVRSGQEIFLSSCVACHGADGKGQSQSRVGFDVPLPDFSDCNFATREPDADWAAIVSQGGPVRGFSRLMPAFGGVLSLEEIIRVVGYIRTFCPDNSWPRGDLNLPRPIMTEKAFPEDEAVINFAVGEKLDSISGEFVYEQRFGARNQIEFVVPFGWRERPVPDGTGAASDWTSNLGDIAFGMKRALIHSPKSGSIFSAGAEVVFPTGDKEAGLGKGTFVFEPFVSYGQILPADFFFHGQFGFEFPFESSKAGAGADIHDRRMVGACLVSYDRIAGIARTGIGRRHRFGYNAGNPGDSEQTAAYHVESRRARSCNRCLEPRSSGDGLPALGLVRRRILRRMVRK